MGREHMPRLLKACLAIEQMIVNVDAHSLSRADRLAKEIAVHERIYCS